MIKRGRVTVNGEVATVGQRIDPSSDSIAIDGAEIPLDPALLTWLLYKPVGVVSTMSDPQGRETVRSLVPGEPVTKPVGRLDLHSEGLMLMTNDGDLALRVTHPRYGIEKVYHVLARGEVTTEQIRRLTNGVDLEDGVARAKRARIVDSSRGKTLVEITMTEGRKRELRRMFAAIGVELERLVRTTIAGISDRNLAPGEYRVLTFDEVRDIYKQSSPPEATNG
ncbi:MAG: pseudouridine synthase [Actinomycetota bacterium]|nr:pseudouridine synthase [Actinomycetota bacterium]